MNEKKDTNDWQGYNRLLIPIGHESDVNDLTTLSSFLVNRKEGRIDFSHVIKGGSYSNIPHEWRIASDRITQSHHRMMREGIDSSRNIRMADSIEKGILAQAQENDSDGIILGWGPEPTSNISHLISRIMKNARCDVIVFKNRNISSGINKILYPTAKDPSREHLTIIKRIIKDTNARLTLTHVVDGSHTSRQEGKEILKHAVKKAKKMGVNSVSLLATGNKPVDEIARLSTNFDMMLLGPSKGFWLTKTIFGRKTDEIANKANCSVILHKASE